MTEKNSKSAWFTQFCVELVRIREERGEVVGFDLGCGDGNQTIQMADPPIGAKITGMDPLLPPHMKDTEAITWSYQNIRNWAYGLTDADEFDFVFCRLVIHFMPDVFVYRQLFPRLSMHLRPGGVIGIAAFYRFPEPEIPARIISFHGLDRLKSAFPDWGILYEDDTPKDGPARRVPGTFRWCTSRIVLRKPT